MAAFWAILGIIAGGAITYWVTTRHAARQRLRISLKEVVIFSPKDFGIASATIQFKGQQLPNVCLLELEIENVSNRDILVPDADSTTPSSTPMPTLMFDALKVLALATRDESQTAYWIPLAKALKVETQYVYINVHRIAAKTRATFQIIATLDSGRSSLNPDQLRLQPGSLPNVDVVAGGLLGSSLEARTKLGAS